MPVVRPVQASVAGPVYGRSLATAGVRAPVAQSASQWARVSIPSLIPASSIRTDITRCEPCHPEQGQILSQYQWQCHAEPGLGSSDLGKITMTVECNYFDNPL